ncbi:hypothetical protein EG831_08920, partial [bacterium]|nr:hypothetical protein [bacterium]
MKKQLVAALLLLALAVPALAASPVLYRERATHDRMSAEELTRKHEIGTYITRTAPPPAGTRNPAEYEPMTGVLICWPLEVPYRLLDSLSDHTKLWMVVSSANQPSCQSGLTSNGINMANVGYVIA